MTPIDAASVAEQLKALKLSDKSLRESGVDTENAQADLVKLIVTFRGTQIPDATIQRELVAKYFHGPALEKLAVLVFRAWEASARELIEEQQRAEQEENGAADAGQAS